MTYSIIGLGGIGSAIARAFAAKGIEVTVAGRRSPEELAPLAAQIGPSVIPRSLPCRPCHAGAGGPALGARPRHAGGRLGQVLR
jgi:NAD(P)-dependent dehydrogenase (short-subunit alcohol dehydrogenase family)